MCLDVKYTDLEMEVWLKKQPDTITVYKVVRVNKQSKRIYPLFYEESKHFERVNSLRIDDPKKVAFGGGGDDFSYRAGFHLFAHREDAGRWAQGSCNEIVIPCQIQKTSITNIGSQDRLLTIVTDSFTIIGNDKFLEN